MDAETKAEAIKRLRYIEGHLAGIRNMIDEDKYCVDVLKQTFAVRRAIQKLETQLLEGHLQNCVVDDIKDGKGDAVLRELLDLYTLSDRH